MQQGVLNVKTSRRCATIVAGFFALGASILAGLAWAQERASVPKTVVVIDIGKVFKEHIRFKQQMDVLKKDMEAFQAYGRNEQTKLQERAEKAKNVYAKGSPEIKKEEEALQRQANELQIQSATKQRDIMEREAKVYFNVYQEVSTAVATFADRNGITLVLRYNSDVINPDDRNSVLSGVNNSIVFQRNLDITNLIIERVNAGSKSAADVANEGGRSGPPIPKRPNLK